MANDGTIQPASIRPIQPAAPRHDNLAGAAEGQSFRDVLGATIKEVNYAQQSADNALEQAITSGQTENLAEIMTAVEKADLAFRTLMAMRNKLVAAYEEISRLRI